jgi:aryl-alcohol dehydrogenase-like predicted oxidoreductase
MLHGVGISWAEMGVIIARWTRDLSATPAFSAPPLALGCNVFGWTADEATSHAILDRFVDAGFSLVDTANTTRRGSPHKGGSTETIIGNWLEKRQARPRGPRHEVGMENRGREGT